MNQNDEKKKKKMSHLLFTNAYLFAYVIYKTNKQKNQTNKQTKLTKLIAKKKKKTEIKIKMNK